MPKPKPTPLPRGNVLNSTFTLHRDQLAYLTARAEETKRIGSSGRVVLSCSSVLREIIDAEMERRPVKGAGAA